MIEAVDGLYENLKKLKESYFLGKIIQTFSTRILIIIIGLITSIIIARNLGPDGRGILTIATTIGALGIQFGNMGLHSSNTYYVARDKKLLSILATNSLLISFIIGGFQTIIMVIIFNCYPQLAPINGSILILSLLWIPFGLSYLLMQNLLIGIDEVYKYNKIDLFSKIVGTIFLGVIIITKIASVEIIFLSNFIVLVMSVIWILWELRNKSKTFSKPSLKIFKKCFRYGIKAYIAALFAFMVLKIDMFMVKSMLGNEQVGYYSIAVSLADMVYMLPTIVGSLIFPKLSAMNSEKEKIKYTRKCVKNFLWIFLVFVIIGSIFAKPAIVLLYGKEFYPSVSCFIYLMPGIFALSVNTLYMNYFASIGMPMITIYSTVTATIINVLLNIKFIRMYGVNGASISASISYICMLVFSYFYIKSTSVYKEIS